VTSRHGPRRKHRFSVACVSIAAGTYLPSRSIAAALCSCLLRIWRLTTDVILLFASRLLRRNECFIAVRKQRLFLWLHSSSFEQMCHRPCPRPLLLGSPRLCWNNVILSWTSLINLICCCLGYAANVTRSPYPRTTSNTWHPSVSSSLACRTVNHEDESLD
jgi:hypothetical protein